MGSIEELLLKFDSIFESMWNLIDFDIDGLVLELINVLIKEYMGFMRKFYRW